MPAGGLRAGLRHSIQATTAAPPPSATQVRPRAVTRRRLGAGTARDSTNVRAVRGRSPGSFAKPRASAPSRCTGSPGRTVRMARGASPSTRATIACALGPVNGGSPASISYTTAASAYTSLRASTRLSPLACSGLMYSTVPTAMPPPVSVQPGVLPRSSISLATPKSLTMAWPRDKRMFSGLMSRWMTPFSCAYCSASPTSAAMRSASATGSGPSRISRSRNDSPSTYSIT